MFHLYVVYTTRTQVISIIDLSQSPLSNGELPGRSCRNDRKPRVVPRTTRILARPTPSLLSGCGDVLAHHSYITNTTRATAARRSAYSVIVWPFVRPSARSLVWRSASPIL